MGMDDMRAELVVTMPDGYRLHPVSFDVPVGFITRELLAVRDRQMEVERIKYETRIAKLERQLDEAIKPKPLKWWQKKNKKDPNVI